MIVLNFKRKEIVPELPSCRPPELLREPVIGFILGNQGIYL